MFMMVDSYYIKKGYQTNCTNSTLDTNDSFYWDETRVIAGHYYQYHVYKLAKKLVQERPIKNVIDIGCGPATKLMEMIFPYCQDVVGIDQPSAIKVCKERFNRGEFYSDNFEKPTLKINKKFDLVICCDVIEHILNPDVLINYIKRFSHSDSLIVFSTPERDLLRGLNCMASQKPEHVREWNQKEFMSYLCSRGFEIEQTKLVPAMKFNISKEYYLFLRRVLTRIHAFNTCQIVLTRLPKE